MSREATVHDAQGKHIASLTHSEMLVLNLPELQSMGTFTTEIAFIEEEEPRIYAYQHQHHSNCYLLIVPLAFLQSTKNNAAAFLQLLCLCSQSVTVPALSDCQEEVEGLLRSFRVPWQEKRGSAMSKLYLQGECLLSYLDLVTFQAVQFKNSREELLVNKRENAFEYCLNTFKEELLPFLYCNQEESIGQAIDCCCRELKSLFAGLQCNARFAALYSHFNPQSKSTLSNLQQQICVLASVRKTTTVGDQQCEQLINSELSGLVAGQFLLHEQELAKMKEKQQVVFLTKIMNSLLMKLRELEFEITDQKILFVNQKIVEKVYEINGRKVKSTLAENKHLKEMIEQQSQHIQNLQQTIEKLQQQPKTTPQKEPAKLPVIPEESEIVSNTVKTPKNQQQHPHKGKPQSLSLKDVKEPLQVITPGQTPKLQKSGVGRAKQKLREGLKKQEEVRRQKSGKLLKLLQ